MTLFPSSIPSWLSSNYADECNSRNPVNNGENLKCGETVHNRRYYELSLFYLFKKADMPAQT